MPAASTEIETVARGGPLSATGLFYADEGHVRAAAGIATTQLHARLAAAGGTIKFNSDAKPDELDGIVIDCRGLAARDTQPGLRGVKGEMIIVETSEVELARPVRLIHPRWPLYVIPRGGNRFMLGATSIEAEDTGVSVRSALGGLLGAAYAVHPAFGEARDRRIRLPGCARPHPEQSCRASRFTDTRRRTGSRSMGFIATASCWRRRWRN